MYIKFNLLTLLGLLTYVTLAKPVKPTAQPVVVLELFTSQGCSSCPAADKALQDITQEAARTGKAVYGLSFHVDYWNRLGWQDPFSSKDYTARQRQYDRTLKTQTYTPQLVVNGQQNIVGGQRGRIEQAIKTIQQQPPSAFIGVVGNLSRKDNQVSVRYTLSAAGPYRVNVALVQKEARTAVRNGENGGKTLVNTNIVRQFKTLDVTSVTGNVTLVAPPDLSPEQSAVLVYVQRMDTGQVVGAKML
ncbi:DUF1223 domain-containing protein [Spirosoma sp. BT702]|uniref:DUF1223 domain-containing protein n=1 Tax=Spirosoma profusum TaxID=2771354 RepID=A0A926Y2W6_9BACT|nr:DUF1223 domain-containing protein [Spirosoma profusum]MBD2701196.1 DUF1223 domain-containing protein [Spirosoma profusum]